MPNYSILSCSYDSIMIISDDLKEKYKNCISSTAIFYYCKQLPKLNNQIDMESS